MLTKANETVRQLKEQYVKVSNTAGLTIRADRMALYGSKEKQPPILQMFSKMGDYKDSSGNFDINKAKDEYRKFLTSGQNIYKIIVEGVLDEVSFEKTDENFAFGYLRNGQIVLFNPNCKGFDNYDVRVALTHELSHHIDLQRAKSWENADFCKAITDAAAGVIQEKDYWEKYCRAEDSDGFFSDIISAISKGKIDVPNGHDEPYWNEDSTYPFKETFSNLLSLGAVDDVNQLEKIQKNFPEIWSAFESILWNMGA